MFRRDQQGQALERYWAAVVRSAPERELTKLAESVDPLDIAAIDRVRALHRRSRPDSAFASKLEHDLKQAFITTQGGVASLRSEPARATNGRASHLPAARKSAERSPLPRPLIRVESLLAAAFMFALIVGGYALVLQQNDHGLAPFHGGIPVPTATPGCGATPNARANSVGSPLPVHWTPPLLGMPWMTPIPVPEATPTAENKVAITWEWSSYGTPDGFANVGGMAIDSACRLWVTDQQNGRFQIFDLDGTFLETWGSANGQFNFVAYGFEGSAGNPGTGGIAFANDGSFYVLDSGNHRVQEFDAERKFVRSWGSLGTADGQFSHGVGIAIGPDDRVYVLDNGRGDVQVFDRAGRFLLKFGTPNVGPGHLTFAMAFAFDPAGNIWVVDRRVGFLRFSPEGTALGLIKTEACGGMNGLAIDNSGNVYCVGRNHVWVYDELGNFRYAWGQLGLGAGEFLEMSSIILDGNGGVYVGEVDEQRVQKFRIRQADP